MNFYHLAGRVGAFDFTCGKYMSVQLDGQRLIWFKRIYANIKESRSRYRGCKISGRSRLPVTHQPKAY